MNFITPSALLIDEKDPYKKIELAGRTCYKSEDKITDESAPKFTRGLIKSGHTAMVEHAAFVFQLSGRKHPVPNSILNELRANPYLHVTETWHYKTEGAETEAFTRILVSGNIRALNGDLPNEDVLSAEDTLNGVGPLIRALYEQYPALVYGCHLITKEGTLAWMAQNHANVTATIVDIDTLPDLTDEEIMAHKYLTVRCVTDRGVTHEMVRHRPASYAQESTRYVNYKTGINIALPTDFYEKPEEVQAEYEAAFWDADRHYGALIEMGEKPQQARAVLPTATKTEIVMTANCGEWRHFFNLRLFGTTGKPHPDMAALAQLMHREMTEKDKTFAMWAETAFAGLTPATA